MPGQKKLRAAAFWRLRRTVVIYGRKMLLFGTAKKLREGQWRVIPGVLSKPDIGLEPMTYALRMRRSTN